MSYRLRGMGATLDVVGTMPPLPPSACAANQTYIPPGSAFTSGAMAGQITPTGACQDEPAPITSGPSSSGCFSLLNLLQFSTVAPARFPDSTLCVGPFSLLTWGIAGALGFLLFSGGSPRRYGR